MSQLQETAVKVLEEKPSGALDYGLIGANFTDTGTADPAVINLQGLQLLVEKAERLHANVLYDWECHSSRDKSFGRNVRKYEFVAHACKVPTDELPGYRH